MRRRAVECYSAYKKETRCDITTRPTDQELCNPDPCPKWRTGGWTKVVNLLCKGVFLSHQYFQTHLVYEKHLDLRISHICAAGISAPISTKLSSPKSDSYKIQFY